MSSKRYIEIVSTYRNRTEYPLISDFLVPISGSNGCRGSSNFQDPVAPCAPIYVFQKGSLNHEGQTNGGNFVNPGLDVTIPQPYVPSGTGNGMYRAFVTPGSFKGYMFIDKFGFSGSSEFGATGVNRLITGYTASSSTVTLDYAEQAALYNPGDYYTVADYSGLNSGTASNFPNYTPVYDFSTRFCPQPFDVFGRECPVYTNTFVNYFMKIEPTALSTYLPSVESRKIVDFDPVNRLLQIESPFTDNGISSDININDIITIRQDQPKEQVTISGKSLQAFLTTDSPAVTGPTTLVTLNATTLANGGANYKGQYIFIIPDPADPALRVDYPSVIDPAVTQGPYFFRITGYTADNTFTLDKVIDLNNYVGTTLDSRAIEILQVKSDNFSPIEYNGTIVSQNETVCYEIELASLTLPNVPLATGSRVAFYPYVYVLLENYTAPAGGVKGVFYSNNPPTHKALFVAPVTDTNDPQNTPFVRIDGFGIVQTVKFKPNDTLHFKVFMPDGSPFEPTISDNFPPLPPNNFLQIRAVFGIRRL